MKCLTRRVATARPGERSSLGRSSWRGSPPAERFGDLALRLLHLAGKMVTLPGKCHFAVGEGALIGNRAGHQLFHAHLSLGTRVRMATLEVVDLFLRLLYLPELRSH